MLAKVFEKLDIWIDEENRESNRQGLRAIDKCCFKVVGQTALLEANMNLSIAATGDLDAITAAKYEVIAKLNDILKKISMEYDQLSNEIWMPEETKFADIYKGIWVDAVRALPEYIIASKAKYALNKNRDLIIQYIASGPPKTFFAMCIKYQIDLDSI